VVERKKKIKIFQLSLLTLGILTIIFTYFNFGDNSNKKEFLIDSKTKERVSLQQTKNKDYEDIFYNIQYTGFDLQGNRYILKSKEAYTDKNIQELVQMKTVEATFYFKDDTTLKLNSEKGTYNNKTLDMVFKNKVKAYYIDSELYANKAHYINSKNILIIDGNVKVINPDGNLVADKLFFDIKKQKLDISSFNNNKINVRISNK
jgi:LPS export ABC transporter protein LptC